MTARRIRSLLPALLLIIAGTTACSTVGERDPRSSGASDLIVVDSGNGVTALRAGDGSIAFEAPAELAMPGRSELVSTRIDGGDTVVATLDPVTGEPSSTARLQGELAVRGVSADGSMVALMAPPVDGQEPWVPVLFAPLGIAAILLGIRALRQPASVGTQRTLALGGIGTGVIALAWGGIQLALLIFTIGSGVS